ncbi:hypothetical protein MC885_016688, partial [Smutsia gigantea]
MHVIWGGGSTSLKALNPAGAGAGGKAGERKGAEPHVFARHNELPKALLVGEGIARATGTCAAHPPQTAVLGLLLLPHQLRVTDLVVGEHGKEPVSVPVSPPGRRDPGHRGWSRHGNHPAAQASVPRKEQITTTYMLNSRTAQKLQPRCLSQRAFGQCPLCPPKQKARLLTVSERSGFRFSLRNLKATTGMMQTTV